MSKEELKTKQSRQEFLSLFEAIDRLKVIKFLEDMMETQLKRLPTRMC